MCTYMHTHMRAPAGVEAGGGRARETLLREALLHVVVGVVVARAGAAALGAGAPPREAVEEVPEDDRHLTHVHTYVRRGMHVRLYIQRYIYQVCISMRMSLWN